MNDLIRYVEPPATYQCDVCYRRYLSGMMFNIDLSKHDKRICDHCAGFVLDKGQPIAYNVPIGD